jgi:hypothetical protein
MSWFTEYQCEKCGAGGEAELKVDAGLALNVLTKQELYLLIEKVVQEAPVSVLEEIRDRARTDPWFANKVRDFLDGAVPGC